MPRAETKSELLASAEAQWSKMWSLVDSMTEAERAAPFAFDTSADKEAHWARDKNLRDVLVHLYEWHRLLLNWVEANTNGGSAPFLPAPYTWKTYGDMNVELWRKHQSTPYAEAVELLRASHGEALALLGRFSDAELFTKKYFPWTGTTSLGSYFISVTASHYDWAVKKIKRRIKELKA